MKNIFDKEGSISIGLGESDNLTDNDKSILETTPPVYLIRALEQVEKLFNVDIELPQTNRKSRGYVRITKRGKK